MTEKERIKSILEPKKENTLKAFRNRVTYETWDTSPIWEYNFVTGDIKEITDRKDIAFLLKTKHFIKDKTFFFNKEDAYIYKWLHDFIEKEIDNKIIDNEIINNFKSSINNFVDIKDFNMGDKNIYYRLL